LYTHNYIIIIIANTIIIYTVIAI